MVVKLLFEICDSNSRTSQKIEVGHRHTGLRGVFHTCEIPEITKA